MALYFLRNAAGRRLRACLCVSARSHGAGAPTGTSGSACSGRWCPCVRTAQRATCAPSMCGREPRAVILEPSKWVPWGSKKDCPRGTAHAGDMVGWGDGRVRVEGQRPSGSASHGLVLGCICSGAQPSTPRARVWWPPPPAAPWGRGPGGRQWLRHRLGWSCGFPWAVSSLLTNTEFREFAQCAH